MNVRSTSRLGLSGPAALMVGIVLVTLTLAGCDAARGRPAGSTGTSAAAGTLKVVATTTVLADIVHNVGGDPIAVSSIIPPGVGPEDYEPKPDDARKLSDADLIVSNGVGLDDFLDKLIGAGQSADAARLVLGDGIPTIAVDGEPNPHFWLDPTLVVDHYLPAIAAELGKLDPDGAARYKANAASYGAEIHKMDASNVTKVEKIPPSNRKLVTFHDAFPYLAKHYGFEVVGVVLHNVGQEPSASDLATLVETVRAAHVSAVFAEAQFSPKLAETLAHEAGVTKVVTTLYNDALGPAPADNYIGLMEWNMDEIVKALA